MKIIYEYSIPRKESRSLVFFMVYVDENDPNFPEGKGYYGMCGEGGRTSVCKTKEEAEESINKFNLVSIIEKDEENLRKKLEETLQVKKILKEKGIKAFKR